MSHAGTEGASWRRTARLVLPSLLIVAAVFLAVRDKAFTIDDTLFLREAEHALTDPLHPTAFEMVWSEVPKPLRMSAIMSSGPVMGYLMVPCVASGGKEWVGHLTVLSFLAIAVLASAALARRLGASPEVAGVVALLVAVTPAALAMASTCMPDVPAMALGVVGIERLVAWRAGRRMRQLIPGVTAIALGVLTRPHFVLVAGIAILLVVEDVFDRRRWSQALRRLGLSALGGVALVAAILFATRDPQASSIASVGAAMELSGLKNAAVNVIAFFTHWSVAIPFAIPWCAIHLRRVARQPALYAGTLIAGGAMLLQGQHLHLPLVSFAAGFGVAAIWDVLHEAWRRRDSMRLVLGLWLLVALPVAFYRHTPPKYLLASLPAAAILLALEIERLAPVVRRVTIAAIAAYGLVLGGLIIHADTELADLGRTAARELVAPQTAAGRTVWLDGHWGFQWYAERAGGRMLTVTLPHPERGDLAVSSLRTGGGVEAVFPNRTLVQSVGGTQPGGRIVSFTLGAGFYGTAWGYLPWWWGDDVADRYDLWRLD